MGRGGVGQGWGEGLEGGAILTREKAAPHPATMACQNATKSNPDGSFCCRCRNHLRAAAMTSGCCIRSGTMICSPGPSRSVTTELAGVVVAGVTGGSAAAESSIARACVRVSISVLLFFSSLLFSGNGDVTPAALHWRFTFVSAAPAALCFCTRFAVKARCFAVSPLCRSKLTKWTPPSACCSQPASTMAAAKPVTPLIRSSNAFVTLRALPSVVCWSAQTQIRTSLPTTASASIPRASAICQTSGLSGVTCSILIQSPAIAHLQ